MLNIEIPPSAPVTKEEREKWLKKAEYGGKTRRLIDHLERVESEREKAESERDALIGYMKNICHPHCPVHPCGKGRKDCNCYTLIGEWARNEAGRKE